MDWPLLQHDPHKKLQQCVKDLNALLAKEEALHVNQFSIDGFEWIDLNRRSESVIAYARKGSREEDALLVILNLTPVARWDWQLETRKSYKREIFNSDLKTYWGTGEVVNPDIRQELIETMEEEESEGKSSDEKRYRLTINLPPLSALILK